MKYLILLVAVALVEGQTDPAPTNAVTCNPGHTVDITIGNIEDIDKWTGAEIDWSTKSGEASCQPTFNAGAKTASYSGLVLPDCALESQESGDIIKYVLQIAVTVPDPAPNFQVRAYNHLYYVSCSYDSTGPVKAEFTPVVNKGANDTGNTAFAFSLDCYSNAGHSAALTNPVKLNQPLYCQALVTTQSLTPNLDLHFVSCWASSTSDPSVSPQVKQVDLINDGCGDATASADLDDTLRYTCADDSKEEAFEITSFRYFGEAAGSVIYFHCNLRVCLADVDPGACDCPADPTNCKKRRKRRSVSPYVMEVIASEGPYTIAEDEGELKEQEQTKSFSTNVAIIAAVSGVVAIAVCVTVFLVVRSRNKRRQSNDLHVVT